MHVDLHIINILEFHPACVKREWKWKRTQTCAHGRVGWASLKAKKYLSRKITTVMATFHKKELCFVRDVNKHARSLLFLPHTWHYVGNFLAHSAIVSRLIHYSTIMLRFIALYAVVLDAQMKLLITMKNCCFRCVF